MCSSDLYDFAVYGFFATIIGAQFFPTDDASTSLMASLGVFAVGFLGRPMGALLLGHLGDSKSRHSAMMLSVGMMVVPTLLMALLPTYAQIGIAAPALLVLLRFVQGMAVGGEYTTSVVVMVEAAQPRRQGYVGSWGKIGIKVGVMLGSSLAAGLFAILSPEQMASWGWRAAFLFGLVLGILVFALRSRMPENKVITSVVEKRTSPLLQAFRSEWKAMLKIIAILMPGSIAYNLAFVYLPIWLKANHNIPDSTLLTINTMAIGVSLLLTPLSGTLADRFGCRTMMLVGIAGMGVLSLPLFWLMIQPSVLVILIAQCTFAAILSLLSGGMAAFMVQAFPKHLRCSGLSVGYNVAVSVFGGSLPLVATFMIERSGYALSPAIYVSLISIVAFMVMVASVRGLQRYATA